MRNFLHCTRYQQQPQLKGNAMSIKIDYMRGAIIPIIFSINKPPYKCYIELNFSKYGYGIKEFEPERPFSESRKECMELVKEWESANLLYRNHHVYGDHQYLVPFRKMPIGEYVPIPFWKDREIFYEFEQIAGNPTTSTTHEALELLPCTDINLDFILRNHLSEPFYIEVERESFGLYVWEDYEALTTNNGGRRSMDEGVFIYVPSRSRTAPKFMSPKCNYYCSHPKIRLL